MTYLLFSVFLELMRKLWFSNSWKKQTACPGILTCACLSHSLSEFRTSWRSNTASIY